MRQLVPCQLLEADGRLVTAGHCDLAELTETRRVWVTAPDQPGRLVRRCLLEAVGEVVLALGAERLPAVVEQVTFDPVAGRGCQLRVVRAPTARFGAAPTAAP